MKLSGGNSGRVPYIAGLLWSPLKTSCERKCAVRAIFVVKPPREAYSLTSSAFLESGTPCPFLLFAPVFRGSLMLKFQKILDKSRIGVYNHIVRSYSRTADQKCVDGCGFPPHAESAFTESCRLVQGSKASACDPPVADSPNPRCTYGRHGDTGVWLPPGDTGDTKTVRISTVKGKCIDGCTEADLAYIYALLSL